MAHFVRHFSRELQKPLEPPTGRALARLTHYHWPGNIRELQNVLERAAVLARGRTLEIPPLGDGATRESARAPAPQGLREVERAHLLRVLQEADWRIEGDGGAADLLGLRPSTLRSRMRRLGVRRRGPA